MMKMHCFLAFTTCLAHLGLIVGQETPCGGVGCNADSDELGLLSFNSKVKAHQASRTAAYIAECTSGGPSKARFSFTFFDKTDDNYPFVVSGVSGSGVVQAFSGKLVNFVSSNGNFAADVVFENYAWTGKYEGQDWTGTITMKNGHTYTLVVNPIKGSSIIAKASGNAGAVKNGIVAYTGEMRASGGGSSASHSVTIFPRSQDGGYDFVAARGIHGAGSHYIGKLNNLVMRGSSFSGDVVMVNEGWTGRFEGDNWKGVITMANGYTYDFQVQPVVNGVTSAPRKGISVAASSSDGAYVGHARSGASSKTRFSFTIFRKRGNAYPFVASTLLDSGILQAHHGKFLNFVLSEGKFSADVAFDHLPWTGKMEGQDWAGTITMTNGYTYDLDVHPIGENGIITKASSGNGASQVSYLGSLSSGGPSEASYTAMFFQQGGDYYLVASHVLDHLGRAASYMGKLSNFNMDAEEFSSDVVLWNDGWTGTLKGKDWKGTLTMENGFTYALHVFPSKL